MGYSLDCLDACGDVFVRVFPGPGIFSGAEKIRRAGCRPKCADRKIGTVAVDLHCAFIVDAVIYGGQAHALALNKKRVASR